MVELAQQRVPPPALIHAVTDVAVEVAVGGTWRGRTASGRRVRARRGAPGRRRFRRARSRSGRQPRRQLLEGPRPVGQRLLLLRRHLAEGAPVAIGDEDRVVAEAVPAARRKRERPRPPAPPRSRNGRPARRGPARRRSRPRRPWSRALAPPSSASMRSMATRKFLAGPRPARREKMPGAPSSAGTTRPESSASAGSPLASVAARALERRVGDEGLARLIRLSETQRRGAHGLDAEGPEQRRDLAHLAGVVARHDQARRRETTGHAA